MVIVWKEVKEKRCDRDKRECDRKSIKRKRKKKGEEGQRMPMKKVKE